MLHRLHLLLIAAELLVAKSALACPDCATARVVRATVFDERFWGHLLATVLPLVVLGVIVSWLYRIGNEGGAR